MLHQLQLGQNGDRYVSSPSSKSTPSDNDHDGSEGSSFYDSTHILIVLVVFIPVIFTILLCTITYCVYQYNRKRSQREPTNSPIASVNAPIATVIYNTQHSPFVFEESPPSYDSLIDTKKDSQNVTTNTHEQFPLTVLPNTISTNPNEEITSSSSSAIIPTAPTTSPPFYIQLNETDK
ncbi:unnamed protein product [Adineta steineri]|uniref:Uncharacterized protein n=1 Tax=Adineta steineri TaxID=433720 RepID=A0A814GDJ0_9BILA|nr:unnamed protein product [Adineta steineri]CAF1113313.1 unnamed protein product [Adineta steineri]